MKKSIREELADYLLDLIDDQVLTNQNKEDWHFYAFNQDYYLIGYYKCSEWLKNHRLGEFEAAAICQKYEIDNFGEAHKVYDNSETVVNMLAYIYGEELLYDIDAYDIDELKEELEDII